MMARVAVGGGPLAAERGLRLGLGDQQCGRHRDADRPRRQLRPGHDRGRPGALPARRGRRRDVGGDAGRRRQDRPGRRPGRSAGALSEAAGMPRAPAPPASVWTPTSAASGSARRSERLCRLRPDDGRLVATIRVLPDEHTSPGSVAIDGDHVWVSNWAVEGTAGPGAGEPRLGSTVGVVDIDASTNRIIRRLPSAGYPVAGMLPGDGRCTWSAATTRTIRAS